MVRRIIALSFALGAVAASSSTLYAQDAGAPATQYKQVISANPFGLLLDLANGEYERVVSESSTAGIGGSMFKSDGDHYLNADLFWRYYPQGNPLRGWAFGVKAGVTTVTDVGTYFGYGFDVNHSWLLGKHQNFYVGTGFGLKKLTGAADQTFTKYIPTIRIVNIGFAF